MCVDSELVRTNDMFKALVESVEDYAIYLINLDGRIASWNLGAERIKQYAAIEIIGHHFSKFFTSEDQALSKPQMAMDFALKFGRYTEEGWRVRKDGSRFWASVVLTTVKDGEEIVGFAKVTRDLTRQKCFEDDILQSKLQLESLVAKRTAELQKANALIRASEKRHRAIVNSVSAVVWRWDIKTSTYSSVPDWDEYTGLAPDEVRGFDWVNAVHPQERDAVLNQFRSAIETKERFVAEYRVRTKEDGYRHIAVQGTPFVEDNGEVKEWVGICMDITERTNLERQLRHSQRLDAVGQLAGGIAHDFNNLLTVFLGYGELLQYSELTEEQRKMVNAIVDSGERAAALTRQLLSFSRNSNVDRRALQLNDVVEETEYILRRLIGEDISIDISLDPQLEKVLADAGQLGQILVNLSLNSRDAMPSGGRLSIQTKNIFLDTPYANTHVQVEVGHYALLMVSDNGIGMTEEVRSRIFEPFFTTKNLGKGTGLGLAVVHGIVRELNGRIGAYSEPGIGTVIKVYIPTVSHSGSLPTTDDTSRVKNREATILFVDDEAGIRDIAEVTLKLAGYRVWTADSGQAALDWINSTNVTVDFLLTDVVMPNMNGKDLASEVKLIFPQVEVLYLSGYTGDTVIRNGLVEEDIHFLQKPFTPRKLIEKLSDMVPKNRSTTAVPTSPREKVDPKE